MFRGLISCALLGALAMAPVLAQDPNAPPPGGPQGGPEPNGQYEPGRAVARLSIASGEVSVRRGDSGELVAAAVNAPLMAGDQVLTSANSRAEIEFDSSNVVRIGSNSDAHLAALDIHSVQIQVAAGTVMFRTLRPGNVQVEVDTPSVAVRPLQPGAYRVTLREDGTSEITVRSGEGEVDSQRGAERLEAGQTMQARGPAADPEYQLVQGIPQDSFDRWNEERDRYFLASQSYEHVNPAVAGGEDLDQNGRWVNDPQYGQVWQPTDVGPNWAPYQNGQWVWEDYYGWTWVSYDPWGWAPYHYGRWFWGAGGWAWWPGASAPYPYWAPAYVGFFGFGPGIGFGVGVGFGFGGVGWVALAPFEIFHPWWGPGFYGGLGGGFVGAHTTLVNNINVYDSFRNARVAGGAIGMNTAGFGRGGSIGALNRAQLTSASAVHGVLPVTPDRSSLRYSSRAVSGRYPQARSQSFASHMQTPRVQHASFEQQQRGMQQLSRGNFSRGSFGGASTATHGWSRFGEPIHGTSGSGSAYGTYGRSGSASQLGRSAYGTASRSAYGGAVRINPSFVQRGGQPSSQSRPAPGYSGGRSASGSARSGGGGHSGGGGGHR
jgi:FecR protein